MKIFLDDIREAPDMWARVRSVDELKALIQRVTPRPWCRIHTISLDHDLGDYAEFGGDGYKILDWLEWEYFVNGNDLWPEHIEIHSANSVGRQNMQRIIDKYYPNGALSL